MGRGQQAEVNTESKNLFNQEQGNANAAQNYLMPAFKGIVANPGYTDPQKTAITQASEGGLGAAFGSAEEGAVNRAGRMNNEAGLTSTEDSLARDRMRTSAAVGAATQGRFADAARTDRNMGLAGIGGLFGQNLQGANTTLGHQAANAQTPGFWDTFGDSFANAFGKTLGGGNSTNQQMAAGMG